MKISFSNSAVSDLENIIEHFTAEGVPGVGQKFVREIIEHITVLSDHPDLGRIVPEFQLSYIREVIHAPFRVVCLRDQFAITVVRIWRSERLLVMPDAK